MLTDEKIMEIAKQFIRWCGGYGLEEAIPDNGLIEEFARKIEKEILENLRKHKVGIEIEFDCDACGCTMVVDV